MTYEFHKPFLFVCIAILLCSACNRKVARSENEAGPAEEQVQITETMEARDDSVLESVSTEAMPSTGTPLNDVNAAETDLPETSDPNLLATTPAPDMPVDMPVEDPSVADSMVMSDEEMLNVAPAEPVGSMSTPPSTSEAEADDQEYEAWFSRHGLDLNQEGMLNEDSDGDGYSNRDEFLADTDPNDASSRPGFHPDIRLKQMNVVEAPVMLESVDGAVSNGPEYANGRVCESLHR